jgi:hypothetical protein
MNCQCRFCDCLFPSDAQCCPVCKEPNPLWEKAEALRLLEENMGDESWTNVWTGVPQL